MSAQARWAAAEAQHLARFRSKFHQQRQEFENVAAKQASASLNTKTLEASNDIKYQIAKSARKLIELRDQYRREIRALGRQNNNNNNLSQKYSSSVAGAASSSASACLFEAKSIMQQIPKFILDDDPELKSTLKIIRAAAAFGFDPTQERALKEVIGLVKRSAYAIDAPRAIQFLSTLQTFNPRPDEDIKAILENVSDAIKMGSNDLLIHEVTTLLSAMLKIEQQQQQQMYHQNNNNNSKSGKKSSTSSLSQRLPLSHSQKTLLDAITRHLVTYHTTAPINDVCKAAAFLTKITSAHGRVLLYEIQPRVIKEANNMSLPPHAALDLLSAYGCVEAEDANPVVHFPRNYDLDSDVAAPPSLSAVSRPLLRDVMLSTTSETLLVHADLLEADDVVEAFTALRQSGYHHESLVDRLISRAMHVVDKTGVNSMVKILEAVNFFIIRRGVGENIINSKSTTSTTTMAKKPIVSSFSDESKIEAAAVESISMLYQRCAKRLASFNNDMSIGSITAILHVFAEGQQKQNIDVMPEIEKLFVHLLDIMIKRRQPFKGTGDALLIKCLDLIVSKLELFSNAYGETILKKNAVKAIEMIVEEIFVKRGGLPAHAHQLIETTEKCVEIMLPQAEQDDIALLQAIKPLVEA